MRLWRRLRCWLAAPVRYSRHDLAHLLAVLDLEDSACRAILAHNADLRAVLQEQAQIEENPPPGFYPWEKEPDHA